MSNQPNSSYRGATVAQTATHMGGARLPVPGARGRAPLRSRLGRTRPGEWPLVIFTLALQLACGLVWAATLTDWAGNGADIAVMRPLAIAAFPILAAGILASLLHLGQPLAAWKSLLNLRQSRVSLEVLLTGLFALSALAYSGLWLTETMPARQALGLVASVAGLAAVVASAFVYLLPSQPVWNSGWLPASFVGTALALGGVASAGLLIVSSDTARSRLLDPLIAAIFAGSLAVLVSAFWMLGRAWRVRGEQLRSGHLDPPVHLFTSSRLLCLGIYVLLVGLLPMALAAHFWFGAGGPWTPTLMYAAYLSLAFGAILGRRLMYSLTT